MLFQGDEKKDDGEKEITKHCCIIDMTTSGNYHSRRNKNKTKYAADGGLGKKYESRKPAE